MANLGPLFERAVAQLPGLRRRMTNTQEVLELPGVQGVAWRPLKGSQVLQVYPPTKGRQAFREGKYLVVKSATSKCRYYDPDGKLNANQWSYVGCNCSTLSDAQVWDWIKQAYAYVKRDKAMRSKGQESATSGWPCPDAKTQLSDSKTGKIVVVGIESAYQPLVDAEGRVREALEREFGQAFQKRTLQVGQTIDGNPAHKEFDAVSSDCKIIAMVKDYTAKNIVGNQTRHARVIRDLYYLPLARAERRFMYLSQEFLGWFRQQNDAVVPPNVEVRRIPL